MEIDSAFGYLGVVSTSNTIGGVVDMFVLQVRAWPVCTYVDKRFRLR